MSNLYNKHRPDSFKTMVGNRSAIETLVRLYKGQGTRPHALLFTGPSGCGKTTLARILAKSLKCGEYSEVNSAQTRGIDFVRQLQQNASRRPVGGESSMWIVDEAHQLTKDAQNGLLKLLEDTPEHAYIVLATTEPSKLIPAIRTRATEVKVVSLVPKEMETLLSRVIKTEKFTIDDEAVHAIVENSDGSPRKALVLLEQISGLEPDKQVEAVTHALEQVPAFDLVKALCFSSKPNWATICKVLENIEGEPENIRRMVLACVATMLLKPRPKNPQRLAAVLEEFADNWFDSGRAGMVLACWQITEAFK